MGKKDFEEKRPDNIGVVQSFIFCSILQGSAGHTEVTSMGGWGAKAFVLPQRALIGKGVTLRHINFKAFRILPDANIH